MSKLNLVQNEALRKLKARHDNNQKRKNESFAVPDRLVERMVKKKSAMELIAEEMGIDISEREEEILPSVDEL